MNSAATQVALDELLSELDIPESGYEAASRRYKDLGAWFGREQSLCRSFSPHVYPQGSFRLGTVVRPVSPTGEFDLDLGCRLRSGVTKQNLTQRQLKETIGSELKAYRSARGIQQQLEEKHRCWRLKYADQLSFHLDTVPSIPEDVSRKHMIAEAIMKAGTDAYLANAIGDHAGAITDNRLPNYDRISNDWRVSNSEGYALWFESRMKLAGILLESRALKAMVARIDDLPAHRWKSPLQACIQILKRHRDVMFANNTASQPISVVLTTLSAAAYGGEQNVREALQAILSKMDQFVRPTVPRVANPVNPQEDFADKWYDLDYRHLSLEENFRRWLNQARRDFQILTSAPTVAIAVESLNKSFAVPLSEQTLRERIGLAGGGLLSEVVQGSAHTFPPTPIVPSRPAGFAAE